MYTQPPHHCEMRCLMLHSVCWVVLMVELLSLPLGGCSLPLGDEGPHLNHDWGRPVRLRHLYTSSKHSYHLQINQDGTVDGSLRQSSHSLVEMRSVAPGVVAIKGYYSTRYLCMHKEGTLYGSLFYDEGNCSFKERLLPDGYNVYWSEKYREVVSLRQRSHVRGKGLPPLSQFLPTLNRVPVTQVLREDFSQLPRANSQRAAPLRLDSMDPLEITSDTHAIRPPSSDD